MKFAGRCLDYHPEFSRPWHGGPNATYQRTHLRQSARVCEKCPLRRTYTGDSSSSLILARFALTNNGNALLATVKVAEKDYSFVVDTGSTGTVFDASTRLGLPVGSVTGAGAEGKVEFKLFQPPDAKVGRIPLALVDAVCATDLKPLREVSGQDIRGILGMDFLGRHVVHIDMEKGELLLLESAPKRAGVELPISWKPGSLPFVEAEICAK